MGFLDNLKDKAEEFGGKAREDYGVAKDKASDLIGDARDRFDEDDATSADPVETTVEHRPEAVDEASRGLDEAVAEAAAASPTETAADQVGDVGSAPAADPLEAAPDRTA